MKNESRENGMPKAQLGGFAALTYCFAISIGFIPVAARAQTAPVQGKASLMVPPVGGLSQVPQNLKAPAKPNSSPVVHWLGITPKTSGGFGIFPIPGVVGSPGSLAVGFRIYEDFSYLRNPKMRTDYTDPVKYIPIDGDDDVYLTLNGDERLKLDNLSIGNYGVAKAPFSYHRATNSYSGVPCKKCDGTGLYARFDLGADLHITPYFRFYGEVLDAQVNQGAPSSKSPTSRNELLLAQAFAEANAYLLDGKEGVQVGRQFVLFHWLGLGSSTQPSVIVPSYDGVRAYYDNGALRTEYFYWNLVSLKEAGFQDYTNYNQAFWGTYDTFVLPQQSFLARKLSANLDAFYFNSRSGRSQGPNIADSEFAVYGRPNAAGVQSVKFLTGSDHRNTFGAEYYGTLGNWTFDDSIAGQTGDFIGRHVDGYYIGTRTGYIYHQLPWTPNPFLRVDVSSGDYEQIGQSTFLIIQNSALIETNLINVSPHLDVMPLKNLAIEGFAAAFFRYNQHDAISSGQFSGSSSTLNLTAFVPGAYVGTLLDLRANWAIIPHLSLSGELAELISGTVLQRVHAPNSLYLASQIEYKF